MWHRLNQKAQQAMHQAQQHAERLGCTTIGPDHLLLGCLGSTDPNADRLLRTLTISVADLQEGAETQAATSSTGKGATTMTLTPQGKNVIEMAAKTSEELGDSFIGISHLIVGVARERTSYLAQALAVRQVTWDDLVASIREIRKAV